jgi:two-component system OmpR family sensor kinase
VLAPDREIDIDVRGDRAPVVLGDEPRLRQVVANLVANALMHTPAGTPVALTLDTVEPPGPARPGWVRVAVHDRGPGLSPDERERVFERFYRADPSRTRAAGGTGLGLSIVAALVAAHGGRVSVESEPGAGSTFAVDLPLRDGGDGEPGPRGSEEPVTQVTGG